MGGVVELSSLDSYYSVLPYPFYFRPELTYLLNPNGTGSFKIQMPTCYHWSFNNDYEVHDSSTGHHLTRYFKVRSSQCCDLFQSIYSYQIHFLSDSKDLKHSRTQAKSYQRANPGMG